MPDALEFPRVLRAVVPLMRGQRRPALRGGVVNEPVALPARRIGGIGHLLAARRAPRCAAVVGTLNDLPEPAARLRGVDALRVGRGALEVIDLPAAEVRAFHFPVPALAVGRQDERAFSRTHQHSYMAHEGNL